MKIIITSATALVATSALATAQISGFSYNVISGVKLLGLVAPHPSTCGIIGAVTLIGLIGARRMNVKS